MITVVIVRNPFDLSDRERKELPYYPGEPVTHYIRTALLLAYPDAQLVVSRNGAALSEAEWQTVTPEPGDYLGVCPVVGKSEKDQKTLGILASIALTVITNGIYNMATTNLGFWGSAGPWATIGYATALNVGAALLAQMSKPKADTTDSAAKSPQSWGQLQSLQGQGNPVALTYGTVRTAGQVLAQHVSVENGQQYLNLLLCGGEGELEFPDGIENIKINDNSIDNYGVSIKEVSSEVDYGVTQKYGADAKIEVYKRFGTNTQRAIPNFDNSYFDQYLGFELTSETNYQKWVTAETDGDNGERLEVVLECPAGLYHVKDDGDLAEAWVQVQIQYRIENEDEDTWHNFAQPDGMVKLNGNKYEPIRQVVSMTMPETKKYYIRCQCVDRSGNDPARYGTQVIWSYLSQVINKQFARPGKALLGIKALATDQLYGSVPTITWEQTRSEVWVCPDPTSSAYETRDADNPAWACYDLIHRAKCLRDVNTGEDCVIHRGVDASRLDYQAFAAWAEFCKKQNLKVNIIIDSVTDLWGALAKIEVVGRGKVILRGTRYSCIYDDPNQLEKPVQLFNMSNIIKDSFSEEFLAKIDRANAIEVSFLNAAKNYQKDILTVHESAADLNRLNPTQIALDGVTDFKQAYREAVYRLNVNKYLNRVIKFDADIDAIACQVGDVILFQHDLPEWGNGGRVVRATSTTIVLDKKVTMESGKEYQIMFRYSKSDITDYPGHAVVGITAPADGSVVTLETNEVTLKEPLQIVPQEYDLYTFGEVERIAKPFRVTRISRSKDFRRSITALEYIPEVYAERNLEDFEGINYSLVDNAVANLKGADYRDFEGKVWLNLSWKPLVNYGGARILLGEADSGAMLQVGKVGYDKSYFAYQVTPGKTYNIEVVAVDPFGNEMKPEYLTYRVPAKSAPPEVKNLALAEDTYIKKDGTVVTNIEINFIKSNQLQTYFEVYYSTDGGLVWKYDGYTVDRVYWLKNMPNSGRIWVKVVTVDQTDTTLKSGGMVATVEIVGKSAPPSSVTGLNVIQDEFNRANLILSWNPVDPELNPDLKGYEVRVGDSWEAGIPISGLIFGTTATYKAPSSGNYCFSVKAQDNSGGYSVIAATKVITVEVRPNAPTNGKAVQDLRDATSIILSWTDVSDKDLTGYEIRMGDKWDEAAVIGSTKENSYRLKLTQNGSFNFMIRAKNIAGFLSSALNIQLENVSIEPPEVKDFIVTQNPLNRSQIQFRWNKPDPLDIAYYEIRQGASWEEGKSVASYIVGLFYDGVLDISQDESEQMKPIERTYWIKAINVGGFESIKATQLDAKFHLQPSAPKGLAFSRDPNDKAVVMISWDGIVDLDLKEYELRQGGTWDTGQVIAKTKELQVIWNPPASGSYKFMLKAKNNADYYSDEVFGVCEDVVLEPKEVTGFTATQNGTRVILAWDKHPEPDVASCEIREGSQFDNGALIATGISGTLWETPVDTETTKRYHIKAINRAGRYSPLGETSSASVTIVNLPPKNVIFSYDEILLKTGTHQNTEFGNSIYTFAAFSGRFSDYPTTRFSDVGGTTVLKLKAVNGVYPAMGTYTCARKDMGSIITANVGSRFVSSVLLSYGVSAKLQYRTSRDGTVWTDWIDFVPVLATFRYIEFRVILSTSDPAKTPEVNVFTETVDVPDVDKYGTETVAVGGADISLGHTYWQAPVVTPTAIGQGLRAELVSVAKDKFKVRVLNTAGTDVGGQINWLARGF